MPAGPSARFLDPATLGRIGKLDLVARTVVEGFISGLHRSPFLGRTMDFAEYRAYHPGDDIRQIDWKLYSRTDRFYVKEYEGDTNANLLLLIDVSKSMDFGTAALTKLDYARYLVACLAYFSRRQRDRVGLVAFDHRVVINVPPAAKHYEVSLHELERLQPGGHSDLVPPLLDVAQHARRRGLLVMVSDFYDTPDRVVEAVRGFKTRGHDVILFHLLDPAEVDLPYDEPVDFQDLESGDRVSVVPEALREQYRQLVEQHVGELRRRFTELGIDYTLIHTSEPLDNSLYRYLSARQWAMKSR